MPKADIERLITFKQIEDAQPIKPGEGDEVYKEIGGGDATSYADEYSVSGWFKWQPDYKGPWHLYWRFTFNEKALNSDASKYGDRTLTLFLNNGGIHHFTTYTYANLVNGAGNTNVWYNVPVNNRHLAWHFVYFGYSRSERKTYSYIKYRSDVEKKL